ncbi:hypothetical protein HPB50_012576 [Hyalomma asiaticum]|uniref:Uncharacterized protein n=1 Tax=Hyalomma asiaticum TaxID=266040 RepID=A0ACB7S0P7_HYAAI|nr:hypothetical protein HPB50_012576 [Hyalomma asiaticum]
METKLKGALSQREALEETLGRYRQEINQLSQQLVSAEEEKLSLRNKISLVEHKHKAEILQMMTDAVHQRAELEAKHEKVLMELASAKADAEVAVKRITDHKQLSVEKEKELEKKHQATRAKDWDRARRLESEKILMEAKLKELIAAKAAAFEKLAESEKQIRRLKQMQDSQRQEYEEEVLALKAKLKAMSSAREDTNKIAAENQVLQKRLALAEEELNKSHGVLKDSQEQKETLSKKIESLQLELQQSLWSISEVKEKLDQLDIQQRQQMDQMITLVKKLCAVTRQSSPSSIEISSLSRRSSSSKSSSTSKEHHDSSRNDMSAHKK